MIELNNLVAAYGGRSVTSTNGTSFLKWGWINLKSAVNESDGSIMAVTAQEAQKVRDAYGEIVEQNLPDEVRNLVRRHLDELRMTAETLLSLSSVHNA